MGLEERIQDLKKELSRTQNNKATEKHIGQLNSKLVRLTKALALEQSKNCSLAVEKVEEDVEVKMADIPVTISGVKNRFSSIDILAIVHELRALKGMRVINVYDIDSKTYLIRLHKPDGKAVVLFESGIRIHKTQYEWPKSMFPSSFSMKFRKHIKQKRLEEVRQVGCDRVVDLRFGDEERACHVIIELYDRGNVLLTDHEYTILNILRPRTDKDQDVRFAVRERYPLELAQYDGKIPNSQEIKDAMVKAKKGTQLKRILAPMTIYGPALIDHCLMGQGYASNVPVGTQVDSSDQHVTKILDALVAANVEFQKLRESPAHGYITYQNVQRIDGTDMEKFIEYHPIKFEQFTSEKSNLLVKEFGEFSDAVDEFYSKLDSQKSEKRALQVEKDALKKVENVKKDHEERLKALLISQVSQKERAQRIEMNVELIDQALLVVQSALANKLNWADLEELTKAGQEQGNPVAMAIAGFDFHNNHVIMKLLDENDPSAAPMIVAIDISLSANQNARAYYTDKKSAAEKQVKTIQASERAIKSAHLKAQQTLNQVKSNVAVLRTKKSYWFEKFFWFISSENYLVVGGRDAHQNELLVKKYFRANDVYVHADLHGASSLIIRNHIDGNDIPPKTLNEAATMAICYSAAWNAKVISNAWWVRHDQVSRTAPTGEYLPTGSFMIRGKKNYLPNAQLVMGFAVLFRVDEDTAERHKDDRKVVVKPDLERIEVAEEEEEEFPDVKIDVNAKEKEEFTLLHLGPQGMTHKKAKQTEREKFLAEKKRIEEEAAKAKRDKKRLNQVLNKATKKKVKNEKVKKHDDEWLELEKKAIVNAKEKIPANIASHLMEDPKCEDNEDESEFEEEVIVREVVDDQIKEQEEEESDAEEEKDPVVNHDDDDDDDEEGEDKKDDDVELMNMMIGNPLLEDDIIGALVVVAPYQTLNNYKYKVKLTPGTGKRGKAAKQAMELFQREKSATAAERKLLKVLQGDGEIARNIPGKTKVQAPQLFKSK
uniref:NFACT-R_1 domain-containing protein n=1 Tax=Rhabditophanes sp. KR3021 TaxID=114890 RepID=A0AC35U2M6_9BILA